MNVYYRSKMGEVKTYDQWREWARRFYNGLEEKSYKELPDDWFKRVSNVLMLEEELI